MSNDTPTPDDRPAYDPVFLNSRREAGLIFLVWLAGLLWAVPFCYLTGYIDGYDPKTFTTTFGSAAALRRTSARSLPVVRARFV